MTLGAKTIESVCELCAAEGYPYNEETCKDCTDNPHKRSDDMLILEHGKYYNAYSFKCKYCQCSWFADKAESCRILNDNTRKYEIRCLCPECGANTRSDTYVKYDNEI